MEKLRERKGVPHAHAAAAEPSRAVRACLLACLVLFSSYRVALCPSPSRTSARTEIGRAGLRIPMPCNETTGSTTASSSSSWWPFAGLHCEHLPAPTVVRYFEQRTMSTSANGAAGAFGTGPSSGYSLIRLFFVFSMFLVVAVVFAMFISNLSSDKITHVHIYATTLLLVIFWIKSNIKMSKFLTQNNPLGNSQRHWFPYLV